ncbi:peptidyl-arginine deiminase [Streptomyces cinnamoneus]|uniref:Peptidyl-arginine deiminase n=1 Tax=Streptomyces cinnamoneus TaxID=53446 RepID=A0A2G1XBQ2_STRCJ|nr:agmatine deiminase family protein [Streptomyces cinnamoneus]PHQ48656.1 peptidyl-arginine deiminase [Streptomyces cinnamoneus]PPT12664.1 agmatine deiminase family protein [Streptomyces cinnamoneus]
MNHLPSESRPHERTFLGWPPAGSVWGRSTAAVREDVAALARTIGEYEPVVLLASPEDAADAGRACGAAAAVLPVPVDDLWLRDTGPVFVTGEDGGLRGVDFRFNGWGGKQEHARDGLVASRLLDHFGIPRVESPVVAEGGSLETDGAGTLLATESSLVNDNRNPGLTRDAVERALTALLGLRKVIWLEGVRGEDVTDCHVDALARFAGPATVLLSRPPADARPDVWTRVYERARTALEAATDADGRALEVIDLPEPDPAALGDRGPDFLGSYVNYYLAGGAGGSGGAVIVPRFGDRRADDEAAALLGALHPGREVRTVAVPTLAEGGGGIHCATQQQPAS